MPGLPDDVREAFAAAGGAGCTFALMPTESGAAELGVVAAVPLEDQSVDGSAVGVQFGMDVHLMTRGVVLQAVISATGLYDEVVDMDILLDLLDEQQASVIDLIRDQEQLGIYFYSADSGEFIVGKGVAVDDNMREAVKKILEEARNHSASILMPDFQEAVEELASQQTG